MAVDEVSQKTLLEAWEACCVDFDAQLHPKAKGTMRVRAESTQSVPDSAKQNSGKQASVSLQYANTG